jgi:hypothetical protein
MVVIAPVMRQFYINKIAILNENTKPANEENDVDAARYNSYRAHIFLSKSADNGRAND